VHFDVAGVSGENQYRVSPEELVSTTVPLMVLVASAGSAALDAAGLGAAALVGA
jgi:hypothetical protein